MNFNLPPGKLNPDAPEVWGCPRLSTYAATWLIDWFDAAGDKQGATIPDGKQHVWISRNQTTIDRMQADVTTWLRSLKKKPPIFKRS